jgi:transposase InsO family protein
MNNNNKSLDEQIALFRFGIISPVLYQTTSSQTKYFKELANSFFEVPSSGRKKFGWKTFKHWLYLYRHFGFDGLKPKTRKDASISRKIDHSLAQIISQKFQEYPSISISSLFRLLLDQNIISPGKICEATLRNYIMKNNLLPQNPPPIPRKKFEKPHINDLWVADFLHGPHILINGKKCKIFLSAIMDDHSRLIVAANWSLAENSSALQIILKNAFLTYGLPKLLYCDNGSVFSSHHLQLVCARLGVALVHSKPYDSPSRGKIERFFRTLRQNFLPLCSLNHSYSLDQFNQLFSNWLNQYHKILHHGIQQSPLDRFLDDMKNIQVRRISPLELEQFFYQTVHRLVKNDSTVSVNSILFEVPHKYIGSKIEIRYPFDQPSSLYLYENDNPVCKLTKLDQVENSSRSLEGIKFS